VRAIIIESMTVQELLNEGRQRHQRGDFAGAETAGQQALRAEPDNADALALLAAVYLATRRPELSRGAAERWTQLRPDDAAAHFALGNAYLSLNQLEAAEPALKAALRLRPADGQINNNLGLLYMRRQETELSIHHLRQAVGLSRGDAEKLANLGAALDEDGRPAEAIAVLDEALRLRPDHPGAQWNRAMARLRCGDLRGGWGAFESWRRLPGAPKRVMDRPQWDGSPLNGRTILLHEFRGHGDILHFVRYATIIRQTGGRVLVEAPESMLTLLKSCAGIDGLTARGAPLPPHDVQAQMMSLPGILGTTLETIPANVPYLHADPEDVARWRQRMNESVLRVGVHWRGNPANFYDRRRTVPVELFSLLAEIQGVKLYCLQRNEPANGVAMMQFADLEAGPGSFMNVAAIIENLHVVVTNDTGMAHLAGALGARTWVLLSRSCDWRWMLEREDSPWYPTMRLFRQKRAGGWRAVVERVAGELRRLTSPEFR
jgi:tetratricopeptide (TPR) repeat protein